MLFSIGAAQHSIAGNRIEVMGLASFSILLNVVLHSSHGAAMLVSK